MMNKKVSIFLALSLLVSVVPAQAITHYTAAGLTAVSGIAGFFGTRAVVEFFDFEFSENLAGVAVSPVATVGAYWFFYKFTPNGRYNRAEKIVQDIKDRYPRVFGDNAVNSLDQIMHDLGAFNKTDKIDSSSVNLNAIKELDLITKQLKKAESLLLAAKKDLYPEMFEWCKTQAQNLYAQIYAKVKKTPVTQMTKATNHIELEVQINELLVHIRTQLNKVTSLYSYIELNGGKDFKEQLKEYEELRALRSQNTRAQVINFAIPTLASATSLAVAAAGIGFALKAAKARRDF